MQLTVGITYHNEGELLTRCIKSFWQQAHKPFEIIIYDDASTLRPEDFIPKEIPVKIIRSEINQGPGKGRNQILKVAQGDWIHFHDADDWVVPQWSEKIFPKMADNDLLLTEVSSYQDGKLLCPKVIGYPTLHTQEELVRFAIRSFILVPSIVVRTEFARKTGGYRESLWQSEDWDFSIRLLMNKTRFHLFSEALSEIQIRKESRSQNKKETLSSILQAVLFLRRELPENFHQDLSDKAAWAGTRLFELGDKKLAREAFDLAQALGPATFSDRKKLYRFIAHRYGQEVAERVASVFHLLKQVLHTGSRRRSLASFF